MVHFIVYLVLVALYIISYLLLKKYDYSKRRLVFVAIWAVIMIALMLYPFFLPKWWKMVYLLSSLIIYSTFFLDVEKEKDSTLMEMGS